MKAFLLLFISFLTVFADDKGDGLAYLNQLRQQAGLGTLQHNSILETAAQRHADYLSDTNTIGHYENNSSYPSSYYSGVAPSDRGFSAGYYGFYYSENLSSGQDSVYQSVDGLMAAIYHRYGFLDPNINEIGVGLNYNDTSRKIYNYNMGNTYISDLCTQTTSYTPSAGEKYYWGKDVCKNITDTTFKISATDYNNAMNTLVSSSPDYIIWPPNNSQNITPAFFEESPDPLPDYHVSGYPISIQFNDNTYKNNTVSVTRFELFDSNGTQVSNTWELNEVSNPNTDHPVHNKFALFPLERLKFNSSYTVQVDYMIDTTPHTLQWQFKTKSLGYPYYTITGTSASLNIKSGVTYALYFQPQDGLDVLNRYTSSYTTSKPNVSFIDGNTLLINATGSIGSYINLTTSLNNTNSKQIRLNIATTDSATLDANTTPPISPTQTIQLTSGWNFISANIDINSSIPDTATIFWQYHNGLWYAYSKESALQSAINAAQSVNTLSSIAETDGTWIYMSSDDNLTITNSNNNFSYEYNATWNLAGTNKDTDISTVTCTSGTYDAIWKYNNNWELYTPVNNTTNYPSFATIYKNEAFWVHCKDI